MSKTIQKIHLGVYGVVIKEDKILLIKKSRGPYIGKLDLPGGKLEHGEDIESGLSREIYEETGIKAGNYRLITNLTFNVEFKDNGNTVSMHHIGLIYKADIIDDAEYKKIMNIEDSNGSEWFSISKLSNNQLSPFASAVVKKI